ncbi:MAG: DUF4411 family protein [Chloroflexota bacterium]|nr:DUF4411 family protein [Chloroflexota bacterium]
MNAWSLFKRVRRPAKEGKLKIAEGVFRELAAKTDPLYRIISKWDKQFGIVTNIYGDPQASQVLAYIQQKYGDFIQVERRKYPGFFKSKRGRRSADSQVVALAKQYGWIVVSDDQSVQLVCYLESIAHITWTQWAVRLQMGAQPNQLAFLS